MLVYLHQILQNFKSKGVETFPPLTVFHNKLCWSFLMYFVTKICIKYANFHNGNFLGKDCELLWRQTFFFRLSPMNADYDDVFNFPCPCKLYVKFQ